MTGLGGIGKTQLVLKFIQINQLKYKNFVWINASDYETMEADFRKLAKNSMNIPTVNDGTGKDRDIDAIVEQAIHKLSALKTLIVLDNISNDKIIFSDIVQTLFNNRTTGAGMHIVMTSRISEWNESIHQIKLAIFDSQDAVEFVSTALKDSDDTFDSFEEKMELVKKLHNFPLALTQAAAHINYQRVEEGDFHISDYVHTYNTQECLDSSFFQENVFNTYKKTTFTTWRVTLNAIREHSTVGDLAIRILYIIAYFDYDNIFRDIFFNLQNTPQPTQFMKDVKTAVRLLIKYSMIDGQKSQSVLSVHKLVQEVLQIQLKFEGHTKLPLREGLRIILEYKNVQEILEHAISVFIFAASDCKELAEEFVTFPIAIYNNLISFGKYARAKYFLEEIAKLFSNNFGVNDPKTLRIKLTIADLYGRLKQYYDALKIFQEVLVSQKQTLGANHSDTLTTNFDIGVTYGALGKHSDALTVFQEVVVKQTNFFGENRIDTLTTNFNIGITLHALGRHSEAMLVFQSVFDRSIRTFGENNTYTFIAEYGIANTLRGLGKLFQALQIYDRALAKRKLILGDNYPDEITIKCDIADTYSDLGRHSQALPIYKEVLETQTNILGKDHLDLLNTKSKIATSYRGLGKHYDALDSLNEIFRKRNKILGADHPDTLMTEYSLANSYQALGRHSESLKIFQRLLRKLKLTLGDDDSKTVKTKCKINDCLSNLGRHSEALRLYEEVFEKQKNILGEYHPKTLATKLHIANTKHTKLGSVRSYERA